MTKTGSAKARRPTTKTKKKTAAPKHLGWGKLLTHHHTGKLRPHAHTSYGSLALLIIMTLVPVFSASHAVVSADATDPVNGAFGGYAVVAAPVPKVAPTIANIPSGRTVTTNDPLPIKGSCPGGTLVKVYKNEVLAGAALCQGGGYQVSIDLFVGNNSLIARAYNANDVVSPDSNVVSVQLVLPGGTTKGTDQLNVQGAPAGQFYATSQVSHRGANVGETMTWPITLSGGQAPYAVSISWGDGKTDLMSRGTAGQFDLSHAYDKPAGDKGAYTIVIQSTDQQGSTSYLQLAAIVSGKPAAGIAGTVKDGSGKSGAIKLAWQGMGVAIVVAFSFWLGEQRELKLFNHPKTRHA